MKKLTVVSGKGGTGKTTIAAAFTYLAKDKVLADCDVDASNLHILLEAEKVSEKPYQSMASATVDLRKCSQCGMCTRHCRFGAVKDGVVDPLLCEGCGVCAHVCPQGAVEMVERVGGFQYVSNTRFGTLCHARLEPGEEASGKLVVKVKEDAQKKGEKEDAQLLIVDGSPGIGCPVIASIGGSDLLLVVTEPTMSGIHDLERILDTADHFKIPACVAVNKADINCENTKKIRKYCADRGVDVVGEIGYDEEVAKAMVKGKTITEYGGKTAQEVTKLWGEVNARL